MNGSWLIIQIVMTIVGQERPGNGGGAI
jgi:hypothetical protein